MKTTEQRYREMLDLVKKTNMELAVWKEATFRIARAREGMPLNGEIIFEKDKVLYGCQGIGTCSDEEWLESFPISELFAEMEKGRSPGSALP